MANAEQGNPHTLTSQLRRASKEQRVAWHGVSSDASFKHDLFPRIDGFEILHEVKRGGQGIVYEAVQLSTRQHVAIKLSHPTRTLDASEQRRFAAEVELAASLKHPNIVTIHDSGLWNGLPYYVMAFVKGQHLDTYVRQQCHTVTSALQVFVQVCRAVRWAHQNGVVHRDLKPSNIIVDAHGRPHLVDFGLARRHDPTARLSDATLTTGFEGTLAFASPEQVCGSLRDVGTASDVYSLGVILFLLLTAEFPYDTKGPIHSVCENIRTSQPSKPSRLNAKVKCDLDAILLKALEKNAVDRYDSVAAMVKDIERFLDGRPIVARPPSVVYYVSKAVQRRKLLSAVTVALCVTAMAALWMWRAHRIDVQQAQSREGIARAQAVAMRDQFLDLMSTTSSLPSGSEAISAMWPSVRSHLESDPDSQALVLSAMGDSFASTWQHDHAIEAYEEALRLHDEALEIIRNSYFCAVSYLELDNSRRAIDHLYRARGLAYERYGDTSHDIVLQIENTLAIAREGGYSSDKIKLRAANGLVLDFGQDRLKRRFGTTSSSNQLGGFKQPQFVGARAAIGVQKRE